MKVKLSGDNFKPETIETIKNGEVFYWTTPEHLFMKAYDDMSGRVAAVALSSGNIHRDLPDDELNMPVTVVYGSFVEE